MGSTDNNALFVLKDKLRELVKAIVEGDDYTENAANEAITTLSALKNLKGSSEASLSHEFYHVPVPSMFLCPISGKLMADPVILTNGKTYDRKSIEMWLNEVQRSCPQTNQVLSHSILTPNSLVKSLISKWCKDHEFVRQKPSSDVEVTQEQQALIDEHINRLHSLLHNLTLSVSLQKEAAKELRQLTKQMPIFRTLFKKPDVIQKLLSPLSSGTAHIDPQLHEDLITTVLNLSIHNGNKRVFALDVRLIAILIDSVRSGTMQTRSNAAAAIFSLSSLDQNRHIIGKSGAIKYLVDLLEEGTPSAMKDAASAIFSLCFSHENKMRTVREGAVQVILHKIMDHVLVDELLAILALLSTHHNAVEALCSHGAVHFLLGIIRDMSTSERSKENCVAILYTICCRDREKREISEDEIVNGSLKKLAECGTSRAKKKANDILEKLKILGSPC